MVINITYIIALLNVFGFLLCFIDKVKAIKGTWRISENTLILVAILGGSLGFYLAMHLFRHKTRKLKFYIGVPLILVIQVSLYLYMTGIVEELLRSSLFDNFF